MPSLTHLPLFSPTNSLFTTPAITPVLTTSPPHIVAQALPGAEHPCVRGVSVTDRRVVGSEQLEGQSDPPPLTHINVAAPATMTTIRYPRPSSHSIHVHLQVVVSGFDEGVAVSM